MGDASGQLWNALHSGSPVVVVYYPDLGLRNPMVTWVTDVADPTWPVVHTADLEAVFHQPHALVVFTPAEEVAALEQLDGRRARLETRTVPLVLMLLRGGDGAGHLLQTEGLTSWIRGNDVDPEAASRVDVPAERQTFQDRHGVTPEQFLAQYRAGQLASDSPTLDQVYRAHLLVDD